MKLLIIILNSLLLETINSLIKVPISSNEKETFPTIIYSYSSNITLFSNNKKSTLLNNGNINIEESSIQFSRNSFYNNYLNVTYIFSNTSFYSYYENQVNSYNLFNQYIDYVSIIINNNNIPVFLYYNETQGNIQLIYLDSEENLNHISSSFFLGKDVPLIGSFYCDSFNYENSPLCIFTYDKIIKIIQFSINFETKEMFYYNIIFNYSNEISESSGAKFINIFNKEKEKIFCSISYENGIIECLGIKRINEELLETNYNKFSFLLECNRHIKDFDLALIFNDELLGCCTSNNKILIQKIELNNNIFLNKGSLITLIKSELNENFIQPLISLLTNEQWFDIVYSSETNELIYHYIIAIPKCFDLNIGIEANSNNEISVFEQFQSFLFSLINKKTTDELYISFISLPDQTKAKILYNNDSGGDFIEVNENTNYEINNNSVLKIESLIKEDEIYNSSVKYKFINKFEYESTECIINLTIYKCNEKCSICYNLSNETSNNCIVCAENYYFSPYNDGNCYQIEEKKDNWFFDYSTNRFYECNLSCNYYITIEEQNLIECSDNNIYYPVENELNLCWLNNSIHEKYYFNSSSKRYELCKEGCKNCIEKIICDSCENNYYYFEIYSTCESSSSKIEGYYADEESKSFKRCNDICKTCEKRELNCLSCNNNYYVFEGNCYKECPINSKINIHSLNKECIRIDYFEGNFSLSQSLNIILSELEKNANVNLIFKGFNFSFHVYYALNQNYSLNNSIKNNISYIVLKEDSLTNFTKDDVIIVLERFSIYENTLPKLDYFFFDKNKNLKEINSEINEYKIIRDSYFQNLKKIRQVEFSNYNALDNNSKFFNDICSKFTNENKNDVIIEDRRKYYYDKSICENNCDNFDFNDNNNLIICHCMIDNKKIESNFKKINNGKDDITINIFKEKIFTKKAPNLFSILKCTNRFFTTKILMDIFILLFIIYLFLTIKLLNSGFNQLISFINLPLNPDFQKSEIYRHFLFIKNRKKASFFSSINNSSVKNIKEESGANPPIIGINENNQDNNNNLFCERDENKKDNEIKKEINLYENNQKDNKLILEHLRFFANKDETNDSLSYKNNNIFGCEKLYKNDNGNDTKINLFNNTSINDSDFNKISNKDNGIKIQPNSIFVHGPINIITANTENKINNIQSNIFSPLRNINSKDNNHFQVRKKGTILPSLLNKNKSNHTLFKKKNSTVLSIDIEKLTYHEYNQLYLWEENYYGERDFKLILYGYLSEIHFFFSLLFSDSYLNIKVVNYLFFLLIIAIELFFTVILMNKKFISDIYKHTKIKCIVIIYNAFKVRIITFLISIPLKLLINTNKNFEKNIKNFKYNEEYSKANKKYLYNLRIRIIVFIIIGFIIILFTWYYSRIYYQIFSNSKRYLLIIWGISILFSFLLSYLLCLILAFFRYCAIKKKNNLLYNCVRLLIKYL